MFNRKSKSLRKATATNVITVYNRTLTTWNSVTDNPALQQTTFDFVTSGPLSNPTVRSDVSWMSATLVRTPLIRPNSARVTVLFDPAALTANTYPGKIIITDGLAPLQEEVNYSAVITDPAPVVNPAIQLSRTSLSLTCYEGTNPGSEIVVASDLNGLSLGTLTVVDENDFTWPAFNITAGPNNTQNIACTFPSVNSLAIGTYNTRFVVSGTAATNNPQYIDVTLDVLTFVAGAFDAPRTAAPPRGWTYDSELGYFVGSIFNMTGGFVGARNGAMPTKTGTVYLVNTIGDWLQTVRPLLVNGTIVDGDTIRFEASAIFPHNNLLFPSRPGWVEGTSGFVFIETTQVNQLPAYEYGSPFAYTFANRPVRSDVQYMPMFRSTLTNQPAFFLQDSCAGYWFTGINFHYGGTNATQTVIDLHPYSTVTSRSVLNPATNQPSHIVLDRCALTCDGFQRITTTSNARFAAYYNCYMDMAISNVNNIEPKAIAISNGNGKQDILGCKCPGWGMSFLTGGTNPGFGTNHVDIMYAYNDASPVFGIPGAYYGNDCKNWFEVKSGEFIAAVNNYCRGCLWRDDQKYMVVIKCTSQGGANYYTKVSNILIWGNYLPKNGKGIVGVNDIYPTSAGAVGTDTIEVRHNIHSMDLQAYPKAIHYPNGIASDYPNGVSVGGWIGTAFYRSQGDGVPNVDFCNNTYEGRASCQETDTSAVWTDITTVRLDDNINITVPRYGPVRGNSLNNTAALDQMFGSNYSFRSNFIAPVAGSGLTGVGWDSTQASGVNPNGYLLQGGPAANFVDPANDNYELLPGHPCRTAATNGGIAGADVPHIMALTAGCITPGGSTR